LVAAWSVTAVPDLATAMNLEIGPPTIHLPLDRWTFARTLPSQRQPDKASIQG